MAGYGVSDHVWQKLLAVAGGIDKAYVKVGLMGEKAAEPKLDDDDQPTDATLIEVAVYNEFGTPDAEHPIPPRPFIAAAFRGDGEKELGEKTRAIAKLLFAGKIDVKRAMGLLGLWGANRIKTYITTTDELVENAPITKKAKGSSRPLVDTGQLKNSMSWQVVDGAELGIESDDSGKQGDF